MSDAVRVAVTPAEAELAADALWQAGAVAIEEQPGALVAGAGDGIDPAALLAAVAARWPAEVVAVDLDAALDAWRHHARAVVAGARLLVRPPWVARHDHGPEVEGRVEVVIDPGRAFGHGAHPSTRLVLAALDSLVTGGERVLDVGCGSGVLAIAALALGAGTAVGVDVDPAARTATVANAARNRVADRLAVVDDVARAGGRYDLVVANLLLPQHRSVAHAVAGVVAEGGRVVVSGVLVAQRAEVEAAYRAGGLDVRAHRADDGWLALTLAAR